MAGQQAGGDTGFGEGVGPVSWAVEFYQGCSASPEQGRL